MSEAVISLQLGFSKTKSCSLCGLLKTLQWHHVNYNFDKLLGIGMQWRLTFFMREGIGAFTTLNSEGFLFGVFGLSFSVVLFSHHPPFAFRFLVNRMGFAELTSKALSFYFLSMALSGWFFCCLCLAKFDCSVLVSGGAG